MVQNEDQIFHQIREIDSSLDNESIDEEVDYFTTDDDESDEDYGPSKK